MNVLTLIDQLRNCWFLNPNNIEINIGLFERDPESSYPLMRHPELGEIYGYWQPFGLRDDLLEELCWNIQRDILRNKNSKSYFFLIDPLVRSSIRVNPTTYQPYSQQMFCIARFFK